jgi:hypothetical protein
MKTKFGTALALAAVLITGTAAAAINTQALNSPVTSTLGTAATTLLPANQAVVVTPVNAPTVTVVPTQTQGANISVPSPSAPNQPVSPAATAATPATSQSATSMTSAPTSPSVVYGNPNPSKSGNDDDNDNEGHEDDGDDD